MPPSDPCPGEGATETCDALINLSRIRMLRWLSVGAMFLIVLLAPFLPTIEAPMMPLLVVAVAALSFNVAVVALRRNLVSHGAPPLAMELVFDLLAWSAFLYFSGGATNPLISILLPFVAIGAAVLPHRQAWGLGLFSVLCYSLLWEFHRPLAIHDGRTAMHLHLLGMWLIFAVSVGVSVWFITRMTGAIRRCDQDLAEAREAALRDEWIFSLGGLAAGAAHELSTPLSTIGTLVEEMRALPDPVTASRADLELMETQLAVCRQALTRLARRAGHPRAERTEPISAEEWLRALVHAWRSFHPGTEIGLELGPELAELRIAPDLFLEQAIRNLVDNAVVAHPARIELSARCHEGYLDIGIADRGPGIARGVIGRLEWGIPQHSETGLGLGLALARGAIERCGGRMEFSARPGGGTRARVLVPLGDMLSAVKAR
uniref:histidine kinase n=1 Tax=Candidatus Kentrum sp. DK TaxID=2126562 RepID=A0A450SQS7_9GAMM|nr:MAG: two-component system, sensor histidine kinase RegB [Candidatus Kentron sp. DK]